MRTAAILYSCSLLIIVVCSRIPLVSSNDRLTTTFTRYTALNGVSGGEGSQAVVFECRPETGCETDDRRLQSVPFDIRQSNFTATIMTRSGRRKKQKSIRSDCGGVFFRSTQTKREKRLGKRANSFVHTHTIEREKHHVYSDVMRFFSKRPSDSNGFSFCCCFNDSLQNTVSI